MEDPTDSSIPNPVAPAELKLLPEKKGTSWIAVARDLLETVVLAVVIFLVINFLTARIRVDGFSMSPTLQNGAYVLVNRMAYRFETPQIGDIIVFHFPRNPTEEYIKRVIGLPGDEVVISDRQVRVNGKILDEPYLLAPTKYESRWNVPADSLFVLGDNRNNSSDSHNWGAVPMDKVVGKAIAVYWPPQEWQLVSHTAPAVLEP
jgi:signal peptidase I